jgi:hypothetical protein
MDITGPLPAVAKAAILAREVFGAGQLAQEVQSKAVELLAQSGAAEVFPDLVYAFGPNFLGSKSLEIVARKLRETDPQLLRALLNEGAHDPACLTRDKCSELLKKYESSFTQGKAEAVAEYRQAMRRVVQSNQPEEVSQYLGLLERSEDCHRSSLTALMAVVLSPAFNAKPDAIVFCLNTFSELVNSNAEDIQADVIRLIMQGFQHSSNLVQLAWLKLYL